MMRWITAHWGLKLLALLLALGIVFVKAQEKITGRIVRNVSIQFDNIPAHYRLPEGWVSPMVQMQVFGPKTVIDAIQPDYSMFVIDVSSYPIEKVSSSIPIQLTEDMLRTNLDSNGNRAFWVDSDSVIPQEILLKTESWNIKNPLPRAVPVRSGGAQVEMKLYRIEKSVPIQVPTYGEPPEDVIFQGYQTEPDTITFSGRKEALDQIQSVSTITLDLSGISGNTLPIFLPMDWPEGLESKPVQETIQEVTVTLTVQKK